MQYLRTCTLSLLVAVSAALASCNTAKPYLFGYQPQPHYAPIPRHAVAPVTAAAPVAAVEPPAAAAPDLALTVSTAPAAPAAARVAAPVAAPAFSAQLQSARAEHHLTRAQERRYERVLRHVQRAEQQPQAAAKGVNILEVILCLFPPLGLLAVYLHEGQRITTNFWVTLLLYLLFVIPGVIFSLLVVTDTLSLK